MVNSMSLYPKGLEYKNFSCVPGADIKIHPRVTVWHHEALPSHAKK